MISLCYMHYLDIRGLKVGKILMVMICFDLQRGISDIGRKLQIVIVSR